MVTTIGGQLKWQNPTTSTPRHLNVDSFENDLTPYSGSTGDYQTQQATAYDHTGSFGLEYTNSGTANNITSTSGLSNYPSSGDDFGWLIYIPSGSTPAGGGFMCSTKFADQLSGGGDGNGTQHRTGDNQWEVGHIGSSINNTTNTVSVDYSGLGLYDTWLEERVTGYDGSQFTVTLYDAPLWNGGSEVVSSTFSSTVYSSGGITLKGYDQVFWDNYVIWQ